MFLREAGFWCVCASGSPPSDELARSLVQQFQSVPGVSGALAWCSLWPSPAEIPAAAFLVWSKTGEILQETTFHAGPLKLRVPSGLHAAFSESFIEIQGLDPSTSLVFEQDDAANPGEQAASTHWSIPDGRIRIHVEGADVGVVTLEALVENPLNASMRYFYGPPDALHGLDYPIFEVTEGGPGRVHVCLDPARPFDPSRTRIDTLEPQTYPANFRTPYGHAVTLTTTSHSSIVFQYDPLTQSSYSTLEGTWKIGVPGATGATGQPWQADLLCGLSGVEYARIQEGWSFKFGVGAPAYAPYFASGSTGGQTGLTDRVSGVNKRVTTAWVTFAAEQQGETADAPGPWGMLACGTSVKSESPTARLPVGYYTQPKRSVFYEASVSDPGILNFMRIWAGNFPNDGRTFPLVPYAGVAGPSYSEYEEFENEVLVNVRREALLDAPGSAPASPGPGGLGAVWSTVAGGTCVGATAPGPTGPLGPTALTRRGVTPKGLLGEFDQTSGEWQSLTVAQADQGAQILEFTDIQEELRKSLLANQLFLVVKNPQAFLEACSVQFQLTAESFTDLIVIDGVPAAVVNRVRYLQGYVYRSAAYFVPVLKKGLGDDCYNQYGKLFLSRAAKARLVVSDWTFDLSPFVWRTGNNPTLLIFKFADAPLGELVNDLSQWTGQGQFLTDSKDPTERQKAMEATQRELREFIADATSKADAGETDFEYFVDTVVLNESADGTTEAWNGVLCLNCPVPLTELPAQLQGLAAGIDPSAFYAHHFGITASSIKFTPGQQPSIEDTSLFGLIYYQDEANLSYAEGKPYQFKVLSLKVLFANSQISNFSSQIELLVGELFGERSFIVGGEHGDNLVLNGVWQRHGGVDSYSFTHAGKSLFSIQSAVLDSVEITQAQFVTILPRDQQLTPGRTVQTRFTFWGEMRYLALEGFDVFSFGFNLPTGRNGGLRYSNLGVTMDFDPKTLHQTPPVFAFDARQVSFDLALSSARPSSLYSRFPLKVTGLVQGTSGDTPGSLGFMRVRSPLQAGGLTDTWFGLTMELNFGSPGGLAAKSGFFANLIAAWSPNPDGYQVYVGIQLPGSKSENREITIEGPLKLKMADILFLVLDGDDPGKQAYMLQFYAISLSFLGLSFPPGGKTNVLLFGSPDPNAKHNTLGWYAAYTKDKSSKSNGAAAARSLPSAADVSDLRRIS